MSATQQDDELLLIKKLDDIYYDEASLYADWESHYPKLLALIKQHDAKVIENYQRDYEQKHIAAAVKVA